VTDADVEARGSGGVMAAGGAEQHGKRQGEWEEAAEKVEQHREKGPPAAARIYEEARP
jgi:hypothetical protein